MVRGKTTEDEKAEVDEEKSNKDLIKELNELIAELENKRQLNDAQKTRVKNITERIKIRTTYKHNNATI